MPRATTPPSNGEAAHPPAEPHVETAHANGESHEPHHATAEDSATSARDTMMTTAATVGVVAVAALVFEAALIPGMVLGVGAMLLPQALPKISHGMQPLFRNAVRGAYRAGKRARHVFAEAQEQVHDIVAEANAESGQAPSATA